MVGGVVVVLLGGVQCVHQRATCDTMKGASPWLQKLTASSSLVLAADDNIVSWGSKKKKWRAVPPVSSSYSETQQQLGLCWDSYVRTDRRTACLSAASQPWRPFTYGNRARRDVVYGAMVGKMDES